MKIVVQQNTHSFDISNYLSVYEKELFKDFSLNFIYQISGHLNNIEQINQITQPPKIANRIQAIKAQGHRIQFVKIASNSLSLNLQLIDSDLPKILAELLLIKYSKSGTALMSDTLKILEQTNPLNYDLSLGHPFYAYKLKNFLTDVALGMTPATIWTGAYDATGGIIMVKESGELVCYHICNRNEFQNYLLNNTRIEQASTRRYDFGKLYQENAQTFLKLNLQIRFI